MSSPANTSPDSTEVTPPRPRRWIPLSLRGLLLLLVLLAGWSGVRGYRQYAAIEEIKRYGGEIEAVPVGPEWIRDLVGEERMVVFDEIEGVCFRPDEATFRRRFAGGGYSGPPPYTRGKTIDDAALACIAKLPKLKWLDLRWTNVSDAGIERICQLHNLERLLLNGTDISDASVGCLASMHGLKELSFDGRKVTKEGLSRLRQALPLCQLERDDWLERLESMRHDRQLDLPAPNSDATTKMFKSPPDPFHVLRPHEQPTEK